MDIPPLSMRLLRVSKAHELLHGIKASSFDNDESFPSVVNLLSTCLTKDAIREGA
jgi:hypothetical protein